MDIQLSYNRWKIVKKKIYYIWLKILIKNFYYTKKLTLYKINLYLKKCKTCI